MFFRWLEKVNREFISGAAFFFPHKTVEKYAHSSNCIISTGIWVYTQMFPWFNAVDIQTHAEKVMPKTLNLRRYLDVLGRWFWFRIESLGMFLFIQNNPSKTSFPEHFESSA